MQYVYGVAQVLTTDSDGLSGVAYHILTDTFICRTIVRVKWQHTDVKQYIFTDLIICKTSSGLSGKQRA